MPDPRLVVAVTTTLALVSTLSARQATLTEEEYSEAMTEIRFLAGDTELHIDARYWPELDDDLRKLRTQFESVEAFWSSRGNDRAVGFARTALEAIEPIQTARDAQDQQAARSALRALRDTCTPCHNEFREETADGFRIKP